MDTQHEFWRNTGLESEDAVTSGNSHPRETVVSTLSVPDSLARTSVTPVEELESTDLGAVYFGKPLASLAIWDQDLCFWKTYQRCLQGGWIAYSGRWPRSGTIRNGTAYKLQTLAPRISGTGCSYLPTPNHTEADHGGPNSRDSSGRPHLSAIAARLPTPTARDWKTGHKVTNHEKNRTPNGHSCQINDLIHGGQLNPTWVEWLMGFPEGWTDLEDSATQ